MDMTFSFARYKLLGDDEFNTESLKKYAEETIDNLKSNDFSAIAERFAHAVQTVDDPTEALEKNLHLALRGVEGLGSIVSAQAGIDTEPVVEFLDEGSDGILATVNCPFLYAGVVWLQIELLVVGYEQSKYLTYDGVRMWSNIPSKVPDPDLQFN